MGYLFYLYGREIPNKISVPLLIAGLYLAGIHTESPSYSLLTYLFKEGAYNLCNFFSGILIVYAVIFNTTVNALFSRDVFVNMGKVSFSAYLLHIPVISTIGVCAFNFSNSYSIAYHNSAILASIIAIFSIYLVSIMYYKKVDLFGMKVSNAFSKKVLIHLESWGKTKKRSTI